jgi:RNA polymerase sigma factor (sigma-70 family)
VFLSLFRWLPNLRSTQAFPGYLRRIALSVAAAHARDSARPKNQSTQKIEEQVYRLDEAISTPIFIKSYLERLPPREKTVITLWYLNGLKVNEIAEMLKITPAGVSSIKRRGMNRLREMLYSDTETLKNLKK